MSVLSSLDVGATGPFSSKTVNVTAPRAGKEIAEQGLTRQVHNEATANNVFGLVILFIMNGCVNSLALLKEFVAIADGKSPVAINSRAPLMEFYLNFFATGMDEKKALVAGLLEVCFEAMKHQSLDEARRYVKGCMNCLHMVLNKHNKSHLFLEATATFSLWVMVEMLVEEGVIIPSWSDLCETYLHYAAPLRVGSKVEHFDLTKAPLAIQEIAKRLQAKAQTERQVATRR